MPARSGLFGRLNNLSVSRKLGLTFALLGVGLAVIVAVGANGMSSMSAAHNDVVNVGEAKQHAAQDAHGGGADMHFSQTLYVLGGASHRSDFLHDRQTFQASLNHLVTLSTDPSDKPLVAAIRSAVARFDQGDAALWSLVRAHRSAGALKLVQGSENDAADALSTAFKQYEKSSAADVASQTAVFDATASSAKTTMILVGLAAVLLAAAAAFLLTRSIAGRTKKMLAAADGIANGDVDQHIDVTSTDELGATAAAFTRMIEYLKAMVAAA